VRERSKQEHSLNVFCALHVAVFKSKVPSATTGTRQQYKFYTHTPCAYVPQDKQAKSVMSYNLKWTGVITIHHLPCVMLLLKESRDPPI